MELVLTPEQASQASVCLRVMAGPLRSRISLMMPRASLVRRLLRQPSEVAKTDPQRWVRQVDE